VRCAEKKKKKKKKTKRGRKREREERSNVNLLRKDLARTSARTQDVKEKKIGLKGIL